MRRTWRQIRQETGFEWVTPHTFRKSVATLVNDEVGSEIAAQQLGHSSDEITKAYYIEKSAKAPDISELLQQFAPEPERENQ